MTVIPVKDHNTNSANEGLGILLLPNENIFITLPFQDLRKIDVSARGAILLHYDFPHHLACRAIPFLF
ncbi:unnamed protein product [Gulo gulo]|uniref:Uncharacterized protein n=1 Tax=Gulo gulo TaxID=48420 RepID=A0A9X9LZ23_GULGU|nr:unnamed protein product [Gulo gulo]